MTRALRAGVRRHQHPDLRPRRSSLHHRSSRAAILTAHRDGTPLHLSRQVIREYLAVVTRPQAGTTPFTMEKALARARLFTDVMTMLEDGATVWSELQRLGEALAFAGRQVHDANIAATMLAHGETRILTCNAADFARFAPAITVVTP